MKIKPRHLAILGSTRGSNLSPIQQAIESGQLNAVIDVVISNKPDSGILDKAQSAGLPIEYTPVNGQTREQYDKHIDAILRQHPIDLIVMIGYMRIVSDWFVEQWRGKMINVHPSLLPKHKGLMNLAVHQAVIDAGETETGCSVHLVEAEVDSGTVLAQKQCRVSPEDTAESLKTKVQTLEAPALIEAISTYLPHNSTLVL